MLSIVPLRQRHIFQLSGTTSPHTFVGLAGIDASNRVQALGALVCHGEQLVATFRANDGIARRYSFTLVRAARRLLVAGRVLGLPIIAQSDPDVPGSASLLARLGFRPGPAAGADWVLE